jgi:hypothetical protein
VAALCCAIQRLDGSLIGAGECTAECSAGWGGRQKQAGIQCQCGEFPGVQLAPCCCPYVCQQQAGQRTSMQNMGSQSRQKPSYDSGGRLEARSDRLRDTSASVHANSCSHTCRGRGPGGSVDTEQGARRKASIEPQAQRARCAQQAQRAPAGCPSGGAAWACSCRRLQWRWRSSPAQAGGESNGERVGLMAGQMWVGRHAQAGRQARAGR